MKEGWEYKKLGEVATIINGKNQKAVENVNGIYPICGSGGIMGYANDFLCPEQTVILGRKGNINRPIFMEQKFWNVDTAFGIVAKKSQLYSKFLYYFCIDFNFEKLNKAVTIPSLVKSDLLKIDMPVPPVSEQQHIVEELDLLSSIIEKKKAQLNELDNLAQSLFYEMFGDPIINNMEWEVKTLKELVYIGLGFTHTPQYVEKGVPFISVKDISSGYIDLSKIKYVSKEEYDNAPKGAKPQKGDLMFCRVGTMGKPLIVETDMQFCTFVSVGYMRRLQNNIDMSFLKYWMLSNSFDKQVEANVRGLAIKNLNTGWLKNFSIYLPPLSIQQQFAEKIEAIEHQKELIKQSIKEVETLFNSRMDYYFN